MKTPLTIACVLVACGDPDATTMQDPPPPPPAMSCGNGALDPGEACDGRAPESVTCGALGLGVGTIACRADCLGFDASDCEHPEPPMCMPKTCAQLGLSCGTAADGCGDTLDCGMCPEPVLPAKWVAVSAGGEHTCAVRDDSSMWCFGRNNFQQIGADGTPFGYDARPIRVPTTNDWIAVAVGYQHSCGLRSNGDAYCWGRGDSGQLGNGATVSSATPLHYTEPQDYPYGEITAGAYHTCALRQGGSLRTCAGATTGGFPDAVPSYTGSYLDTTASGGDESCAVTVTGALRCDVLGNNATSNSTRTWVAVDVGDSFWCALATGGTLYCRGDGIWGQLGNGADLSSTTPVAVGTSHYWVAITAGGRHACGITANGTLYCWGANENGQLGDTTTQRRNVPTYIGTGWAAVSAGDNHTCGIRMDDSLWCWGEGSYGRLGINSTSDATAPTRVVD